MATIADISKDDFLSYENCRESGVTNMFDLRMVNFITDLPREKIIVIMSNYGTLKDKYLEKEVQQA